MFPLWVIPLLSPPLLHWLRLFISPPCFFPALTSVGKSLIVSQVIFGPAQLHRFLEVQPKLRARSEEMPQAQSRVPGYSVRLFKISVMRFVGTLRLRANSARVDVQLFELFG